MKKRIFKLGAALTAALMVFSATASMAFAAEGDDVVLGTEVTTEVTEAVTEAPEVVEEEVTLTTEEVTEETIELAAKADDVATGSVISIGTISATKAAGADYYSVSVPFTLAVGTSIPSQLSFFVYDITAISGDQNNTVGFQSTTPVGYINQYTGALSGTYSFKLDAVKYTDDSIIVVKIGGTGVSTPDAKSYKLGDAPVGLIGDADFNGEVDNMDAALVMKYFRGRISEQDLHIELSDAYLDGTIDNMDAATIMKYFRGRIGSLPVTPE